MVDCVFCRLLSGGEPVIWVARHEGAAALLPRPGGELAPGHTLVIPTEHAVGIQDVTQQSLSTTITLVSRVALAMEVAFGARGVNVLNASGPGSEQSVPHLHFHVVPRWDDDGFTTWPSERSCRELTGDVGAALAEAMTRLD